VKPFLIAFACVLLGSSGLALAQNYNGVVPGSGVVPEHIAAAPGGDPVVTWPGFQMTPDGGSRIFVQTTVEVKPSLQKDGSNWTVVIPGVALPPGNARLPLDTQYFNTPVKNTRLKARVGGGVVIHIELKPHVAATPHLRTERAQTGYFFVYVEFAPGTYR
jgi:hypothetical protein